MIAGLPDGGTPVAFVVCTRLHSIPTRARLVAPHPDRSPADRRILRLTDRLSPAGEARHIAFLSAV